LICFPFGECEPCPPDEVLTFVFLRYNSRRSYYNSLINLSTGNTIPVRTTPSHPSSRVSAIIGETPAWEFCGRIISRERADWYESIACNVLSAVGAMLVIYIRVTDDMRCKR
ncbi:hypothetical protein C8R41DRAFT_781805, partial [Lentinula lateritia]